jgi:DNA repair photolyase
LMAPILPGLSDSPDQLSQTVAAIAAAGAQSVTPIVLHLRPGAREWFMGWLEATHPELVPRYRTLYRASSYALKAYQDDVCAQVRALARAAGIGSREPVEGRRMPRQAERVPAQPARSSGTKHRADERIVTVGDQLSLL